MNKKTRYAVLLLAAVFACLLHIGMEKQVRQISSEETGFTDCTWIRETEEDTEYLMFGSDGSFSYYCACGDPVNDADLCEGYTYDDKNQTITLKYSETTAGTVDKIRVLSCGEQKLELDFNGETRVFTKEE